MANITVSSDINTLLQSADNAAALTNLGVGAADITATGSTEARSINDRFADTVNVKDFGAVGDGVTDDTVAIQAAINAAEAAGGGTVYFPTGFTFDHTGLTIDSNNVHVSGYGAVLNNTSGTTSGILLSTVTDCSVRGMAFTGIVAVRDAANHHIHLSSCTRVTVEDCYMSGGEATGIICYAGTDIKISSNHITGTLADGIHIRDASTRVLIRGNTVNASGDDCIAVVGYQSETNPNTDIVISGNNVNNGSNTRGITVLGADRVLIDGNTVRNTASAGIHLGYDGSFSTLPVFDVVVTNNVVSDTNNSVSTAGIFIQGSPTLTSSRILIANNIVRDAGNRGIASSSNVGVLTIRGNVITASIGAAVNAETCTELVIENNLFQDVDNNQIGITPFASGNAYIRNNIAQNMNSSATASRRFVSFETSTPDYIEVTGNHVNGGTMQAMVRSTAATLANIHSNFRNGVGDISFAGEPTTRAVDTYWSNVSFTNHEEAWTVDVGDETTAVTTGTAKVTFRVPYAMTVTGVRASLATASSSGIPTVDINDGGTTILSTKLTIDASEKTSTTAATAAVISDSSLADDAEVTIDVDAAGTGAAGLKVTLLYTRP